jgi:enoyl-CoA hydratase/carnithine racemase
MFCLMGLLRDASDLLVDSREDRIDAAQALALEVVNRVAPDADLVEATMLLAGKLARGHASRLPS